MIKLATGDALIGYSPSGLYGLGLNRDHRTGNAVTYINQNQRKNIKVSTLPTVNYRSAMVLNTGRATFFVVVEPSAALVVTATVGCGLTTLKREACAALYGSSYTHNYAVLYFPVRDRRKKDIGARVSS